MTVRRDSRRRDPRPAAALLGVIVGGAFLAACGSSGGGDPTSPRATSETSASPEPTTPDAAGAAPAEPTEAAGQHGRPPAFSDDRTPATGRGTGEAGLVLTDVRVAERARFDRIVLRFSGTGTPGWTVDYVDQATLEGSGEVVPLGRDAVLDIYASDTTWPAPDYYDGPTRLEAAPGGVTDVYVAGTFEGYTQVLAGIDDDRVPFRVFALANPSRLVVDVVDDNAD